MTKFGLSLAILLRSANIRGMRNNTKLMENIGKFMGIIRSENFDRFRKLCFNYFGKVTIY